MSKELDRKIKEFHKTRSISLACEVMDELYEELTLEQKNADNFS